MAKRILTVFGTRDELALVVLRVLEEKLAEVDLDSVWTAAAAKQKLLDGTNYALIITHVNVPADTRSSDPEEQQGLKLLKFMDDRGLHCPSILLTPSETGKLLECTNEFISRCYVLNLTGDWQNKLISRSKLALDPKSRRDQLGKEIKAVSVDISVAAEKERAANWDLFFKVEGGDPVDPKPVSIQVEPGKIRRLIEWSQRLEHLTKERQVEWEPTLRDIGEELREVLLGTKDSLERFSNLKGMAGGLEKFRIRFKVKRSAHPMILEALAERRDDKWDYWMLKAPIYRSVWTSRPVDFYQSPLFHGDSGPYNCLIIQSDIGDDYVPCLEKQFERLTNIQGEVDFLAKFLSEQGLVKVKKIPEEGEVCSHEMVKEWLIEKGPWHMVHYAGHSYFGIHRELDKSKHDWIDKKEGLLFFPSEKGVMHITCEEFSQWLRAAEARFVYLSSCRSSEEDFLYELADCGIPSAIGFRWDIKDDLARAHTEIFYTNLVNRCSLEYAFLDTRRYMHDRHHDEIIWAAPVLIMQVSEGFK